LLFVSWQVSFNFIFITLSQVDIYRGENESTVRDDPFDTDLEALDSVMEVVEKDGIRLLLEGYSEVMP
jgi:hypothetical protein